MLKQLNTIFFSCCIILIIYMMFQFKTVDPYPASEVVVVVDTLYIETDIFELDIQKNKSKTINDEQLRNVLHFLYIMCDTYDVPYDMAKAVIDVESNWNPNAKSSVGAMGLMQIMPITARQYGYTTQYLYNPYVNILIGIKYLSDLYNRYESWNYVLTAYNHGPGNASRYSDWFIANNTYVKLVTNLVPDL